MAYIEMHKKILALTLAAALLAQPAALAVYGDTIQPSTNGNSSKGVTSQLVFELNKPVHNFTLVRKTYSKDLESDVYEFEYKKNGGKLVYIANDDNNKWFDITFKTPAVNNTGVNHILEHAVLEGSAKYNFKSPYTELSKRSVNTYMNALTGMDFTTYPVASENDHDFQNLMEVYLDAVFAPKVITEPRMLQQEGWRYEVNPTTGKWAFNGIVFNELKGSLSEKMAGPYEDINKLMYPDTKYRFNSGGEPISIVDLSHEQLAATYNKYYNPSNACVMLYGKMDIDSKLAYLDEQYYSKYDPSPEYLDCKIQKPFSQVKFFKGTYPADKAAVKSKTSVLSYNLVVSDVSQKDKLGLQLLISLLSDADDSPLKNAVLSSKLGTAFSADVSTQYSQPLISMIAEGADSSKMSAFDKLIKQTLKTVSQKGIGKEKIQAMMNTYDLGSRLKRLSVNNGEDTLYQIINGFVVENDPVAHLNNDLLVQEIKLEAMNSRYFENLIDRYLLGNKHVGLAVFEPDSEYMGKMENKLAQKLVDRQKSLNPNEKVAIESSDAAFKKWQAEPLDQEALKSLPTLKLSDLAPNKRAVTLEKRSVSGVPVLSHEVASKGTTQVNLYFDLDVLTKDELLYLELFKTVLSSSAAGSHKAEDMTQLEDLYTTGIGVSENILRDASNKDVYKAYLNVRTSFLNENASKATELLIDRLKNCQMDDKELVREKLDQLVGNLASSRMDDSLSVTQSNLMGSMSQPGAIEDLTWSQGFKKMARTRTHFDKSYSGIRATLNGMYQKLFTKAHCTLSVAADAEGIKMMMPLEETLIGSLSSQTPVKNQWQFQNREIKTALITPSQTQFITAGFATNVPASGSDFVFAKMLSEGYMYDKIRLEGGAYGGGLSINRTGTFQFYTYRDPNLKKSLESIQKIGEYAKAFKPSQSEIDAAILSIMGSMDASKDVYSKVDQEDGEYLTGYDLSREGTLKQEILRTTAADLPAFLSKLENGLPHLNYVVAGSESEIRKEKGLFTSIMGMLD